MKTALQELIDWEDNFRKTNPNPRIHASSIIGRAKQLLDKEKELMCKFAWLYDEDLAEGRIRKPEVLFEETFLTNPQEPRE